MDDVMTYGQQRCQVPGCERSPLKLLPLCGRCWSHVPTHLRSEIRAHALKGMPGNVEPSLPWGTALRAAVECVPSPAGRSRTATAISR